MALDLTNINLATDVDKTYNIDKWARLFKAQTWEDIKMLAKQYEAIDDAATTIYQISEDEYGGRKNKQSDEERRECLYELTVK